MKFKTRLNNTSIKVLNDYCKLYAKEIRHDHGIIKGLIRR